MVKLTEEMVVARTRMSDLSNVKKLNCWGSELTDVSILRKMKNVEVLSLSHLLCTLTKVQVLNYTRLPESIRTRNISVIKSEFYIDSKHEKRLTIAEEQFSQDEQTCQRLKSFPNSTMLNINNISTLADFQYCHKLRDLFIRRNNIKDLNEVCYLQGLPNLRNLWLGENPCAKKDGYRLAVLRALPNLEKLDDKAVLPEDVQTAVTIGRPIIHPLEMDTSPQSDTSPNHDITIEFIEETELEQPTRYSSCSDQKSFEIQNTHEKYDPDKRNANYDTSHHYSQNNHYAYENEQSRKQNKDDAMHAESRSNNEIVVTNTLETSKDYDDRSIIRHNEDYDDKRAYPEYSGNEASQRPYATTSQRTQYAFSEPTDDRRSEKNTYDYDERIKLEYEDSPQLPHTTQTRRMAVHHNVEKEDTNQMPGWIRHSERDKCRSQFHYHRRPVTRNSNILSAVLCLVKELDYPSLEVVEMAIRNRMDELEE